MNRKPDNPSPSAPRRRLPKGPLIVIVLVLASMAWVYWLTSSTPMRPRPEFPPVRKLPLESDHPQQPGAQPATGQAREP